MAYNIDHKETPPQCDSCQPQDKKEPRFFLKKCLRGSDFQPTYKLHSEASGSSLE